MRDERRREGEQTKEVTIVPRSFDKTGFRTMEAILPCALATSMTPRWEMVRAFLQTKKEKKNRKQELVSNTKRNGEMKREMY